MIAPGKPGGHVMQTRIRSVLLAGLFAGLISTPSVAQPAAVQQSFVSLIGAGYKVVGTFFVPANETSVKTPTVVVSLQKDNVVAVCTFSVGGWESISNASGATDAKACDVRAP